MQSKSAVLTVHAAQRLWQRCALAPEDLKQILNSNKCILLESEGAHVAHRLFYSKPDDACFVVIQSIVSGAVITIMPAAMWSTGPAIGWRLKILAKSLVTPREKVVAPKSIKNHAWRKRLRQQRKELSTLPIAGYDVLPQGAPVAPATEDYKFYVTLAAQDGTERPAYLARFGSWDVTNATAILEAVKLLRAQIRQVSEDGEKPTAIHMQLGATRYPVDELLSRLT